MAIVVGSFTHQSRLKQEFATDKLKPGEALPSVREFARRLRIHHNTVSQAYKDLVRRSWLVGRRGSRVVVRERGRQTGGCDLDDLINATIKLAREQGYSLQMGKTPRSL